MLDTGDKKRHGVCHHLEVDRLRALVNLSHYVAIAASVDYPEAHGLPAGSNCLRRTAAGPEGPLEKFRCINADKPYGQQLRACTDAKVSLSPVLITLLERNQQKLPA
ncbi:hypothetical protein [Leptolyngbya sp. FACHB-261]|uniref:hypothetical protein n=1 Tax=Leptolyngbya sp. FACHB-261 TaxID=2692806 RepID=UPI0016855417|nr:hypothetical protein [Leptolyngbya sp. FACHB-261]MBD2100997.1 hypothetical protein [Leptolyngbya sp. FACHB-261]